MKNWTPQDWTIFFTAAGVFFAGVVAGIVAVVKAFKADAKAEAANSRVDVIEQRQDRQSTRMGAVEEKAFQAVAMADPKAAEKVLTPPKGPTE